MWVIIDSLKEFYGAEAWGVVGMGLRTFTLPGYAGHGADMICHFCLPDLGFNCAANGHLLHS